MEEKYFQISEFARIAKTSRKTLQYYDELGLFRPARVGRNGYRYYTLSQLDRLALIAALRDMGLSLGEIASYLQCGGGERLNALLEEQLDRAGQMVERLRRRQALLTEMLAENRLFQALCGKGYQLMEWPPQRAATLMALDQAGPVAVNYLTDGLHIGLCVQRDRQFLYQRREDGELLLPGGSYLCLCDLVDDAPQQRSPEQAAALREHGDREGLRLDGCCYVEFNDLLFPEREGRQCLMRLLRVRVLP